MNGVIADFGEAEDAFNLDDESRQFLGKLGVVCGSVNTVQQLFAHQLFQRVAKSETLLYALCGFALGDPSPMKFYS
jgi:hypothetical protein